MSWHKPGKHGGAVAVSEGNGWAWAVERQGLFFSALRPPTQSNAHVGLSLLGRETSHSIASALLRLWARRAPGPGSEQAASQQLGAEEASQCPEERACHPGPSQKVEPLGASSSSKPSRTSTMLGLLRCN